VPVKGLADPVEIYEVTGAGPARTRLQAGARRGLTRFVGRDPELEQLRRAQQLAGDGHGQVVAVVGEAGVGKSRLVHEFSHSHRLQGWRVLESASVSYGKATSYLPVIDLLKGYFKIQDRDDLREIREKVTGKLLTLDRTLEPTLPGLLALLDVPVDDAAWQTLAPAARRQRTLDAVKGLLLREAREQPLLVIFEDLHWIDSETQALLDGLVESLGSARLLLLVDYRPEYQHGWSNKTSYSQLRLDALPAERAGELLDALLGDDPGLAPLKQLLVKRGNPFFLEETVRTLVETEGAGRERGRYRLTHPVHAIQVPPTVQVMLAARIDRLLPEDKRLLQTASVVGKDVPFALLQAIADLPDEALRRGLDHLRAAEFVYETGLYPNPEYSFTHALTQDVTYSGLLQERRHELHARIVEAIETLHGDRLGEHIERLAHHAGRAQLREKAVDYLRQAGVKAAARSALRDARTWFEQALDVLAALPDSHSTMDQAFEIRLELRPVLAQLGEIRPGSRAAARGRGARRTAERRRPARTRVRLHDHRSQQSGRAGRGARDRRPRHRDRGRLGDLRLRLVTTTYLEQAHFFRGDYDRVIELATENLAALPTDWTYESFGMSHPASVYDRCWLIHALARLGRFTEAGAYEADAIRLAQTTQHANTVGMAHYAAGVLYLLKGDWAKARGTDRARPRGLSEPGTS
jgi:predicted ATPase